MRRVRYSVAASLDGYIAGPHGEYDWIVQDPDFDFAALFAEFDTFLVGRKTYEAMRNARGAGLAGSVYVFSRSLRQEESPGVIVSHDPQSVVDQLKAKPGKDIWLFGGASLFVSLLDLGLVDGVEVSLVPILLGEGISLTAHLKHRHRLRFEAQTCYPKTGIMRLNYSIAN
jgi:dihydrofolate reductase